MKNKFSARAGLLFAVAVFAAAVLAPFAAAVASGVSLTTTNTAPTVPTVVQPSAADPTSCATTSVTVQFNATDTNGITDLNLSASYANLTKGATTRQLTTCVSTTNYSAANTMLVSCTGNMQYYDATGTWTATAAAVDFAAASGTNNSISLTYNTGTLMDIQYTAGSSITFGNVAKGSSGNMDTDGLKLRNCGNAALNNSITGAAITDGGTNSMAVGQFYIDDDTTYGTDGSDNAILPLTTAPQAFSLYAATGIAVSTGSDSTWSLYSFVNVPSSQAVAIYTTGSWTFTPSAA